MLDLINCNFNVWDNCFLVWKYREFSTFFYADSYKYTRCFVLCTSKKVALCDASMMQSFSVQLSTKVGWPINKDQINLDVVH